MIDVLYLAWNRLAYTQASFTALLNNTDWSLVKRLWVYDDGSTDGTRDWLDTAIRDSPVEVILRAEESLGPVAIMRRYIDEPNAAPLFAKIDNDIVVPPGWLQAMSDTLERHQNVELLGMEAGMTVVPNRDGAEFDGVYGVERATNIGGVGLMRLSAFRSRPSMRPEGRNGFTFFQHQYRPVRAWITPDLPVLQLDRLPFEPWRSLAAEYVEEGWAREWPPWDEWMAWTWRWFAPDATVEVEA
jgi:GT2 family glycosyltransferase